MTDDALVVIYQAVVLARTFMQFTHDWGSVQYLTEASVCHRVHQRFYQCDDLTIIQVVADFDETLLVAVVLRYILQDNRNHSHSVSVS